MLLSSFSLVGCIQNKKLSSHLNLIKNHWFLHLCDLIKLKTQMICFPSCCLYFCVVWNTLLLPPSQTPDSNPFINRSPLFPLLSLSILTVAAKPHVIQWPLNPLQPPHTPAHCIFSLFNLHSWLKAWGWIRCY